MKKTIRFFISAVLLLVALPALAQTQVTGHVYDSTGEPLIGASVMIKGTMTGSITDIDGAYSISAKSTDVLVAEFLGFNAIEETVGSRKVIDFKLSEDKNVLDDVVVIAYGAAKKSDLTGSVANVKMGDIKDTPTLSIDNALQGRIAGADFMSTDGSPGATTSIRIRGTRSISASNEPLFIVDGIMDAIHDLNDINSDDIASISVLKDASSTAIYGSRGANGVIIITTKKGTKSDKVSISFKADFGLSQLPKSLDIMNASEFVQYRNDYAYFGDYPSRSDVKNDTPLSGSIYADPLSYGAGTDWIRNITRNAFNQNYALSVNGGGEKGSFYASFAYNDTEGIIDGSGQQRFSGRFKGERQIFKWLKAAYNGSYTWRYTDENKATIGGTSWWNGAQYLSPLLKVTDSENPLYTGGAKINTPRAMIDLNTNETKRNSMNHAISVDITPVENLVLSSVFSYYLYFRQNYIYQPGSLPAKTENEGGYAKKTDYNENSMSSETTLRYKLEKNGHSFQPLVGFSLYSFSAENFSLSGSGYMDDQVKWNNMNAVLDKETYSAGSSYSSKAKMSAFARVDYNWKSRYYLTATGRFDGASNFAANNKWAFFPSAALRWNISNEDFMSNVSWIDELSLRFSAGLTGNDAIGAYMSLARLESTTGGYLFGGSQPASFYRSRLADPGLTWEKTASYNLALDWAMLGGRLSLTAEAYLSRTTDLLLEVQVANQTGYSKRMTNLGEISNKGLELSVESRNIEKKNFQWTTSFTISHNTQRVINIGSEDFVKVMDCPGNNKYMIYGYVEGYPLNSLWGFKYGGLWKSDEERERNKQTKAFASEDTKWRDGTPKYYDINHDGVLNQQDLVYQGSADPIIYGGLQNTFYYRNFKLGVYFAYSLGGKIYNYGEFYQAGGKNTNQFRYMLDSWHPERNPESNIPRAGYTDVALPSDFMIHDASYLRLKNISLGYTLDLSKYWKNGIRDVTFTFSGENLYLWKNYNGFDPDVSSNSDNAALRRVDLGAYPKSRTFTFSVQIRY